MKRVLSFLGWLFAWIAGFGAQAPLQLAPENPHYFLFRGKPTVLIGSGEHYGAVINLDFDFATYVQTLEKDGLNLTRTFSGAYVEPASAFNIRSNTLAPLEGRYIAPWPRSETPGYAKGGSKFDLSRWNENYFARLRDFVREAGRHHVVVEMNLFCPFYDENQWALSPMNAANNVNQIGGIARTNVYTLDRNGALLKVQEEMVRKFVTELNGFDNLYYEICNEPYFGGVTLAWQHHMASVISEAEKGLPHRHLISQNIANKSKDVPDPDPLVSILNFHYAIPPMAVKANYQRDRVIGDNETGFLGTNNAPYRMEAWDFITSGGGLFNHLDYSFVAGKENGTFDYPATQPGGGNPELRRQFGFLKKNVERLDFVRMVPIDAVVAGGIPTNFSSRVLARPGNDYLIYLRPQGNVLHSEQAIQIPLVLSLPAGNYKAQWLDPIACKVMRSEKVAAGHETHLLSPGFHEDIALLLRR